MKIKKVFLLWFFIFYFFVFPFDIDADQKQYLVDYSFIYQPDFITYSKTNVYWKIKITHLFSDVYVKNFKVIFPDYFTVEDIKARNEKENLEISLNKKDNNYEIIINLNNLNIGKNSTNNIYLSFVQKNLFKNVGNITETFIPTIKDPNLNSYQIVVQLPKEYSKKISLSKPKPDKIEIDENFQNIYWFNPKVKTIYAIFGEEQYYQYRIDYQIKNSGLTPGYFLIALIPETTNQKIYLEQIYPLPDEVYLNDDDNLEAKYLLLPMVKKNIRLEGKIKLTTKINKDYVEYSKKKINKQKSYLISSSNYWKINTNEPNLKNDPKDIYQFVLNHLDYDYDGLGKITPRSTAENILREKKSGLCLDYTDLFVTLARENGLYSRAIIGYGYSSEKRLRPMYLQGDILHAWPEFYNIEKESWQQVDPTWEDTSGIDYFEYLDLNHIAFVIYGKNDDRPAPAGFYKEDNGQKIFIQPINEKPKEIIKIRFNKLNLPKKIFGSQIVESTGEIINNSNVYLYNIPLTIISNLLIIETNPKKIEIIPPLGKIEFNYQIKHKSNLFNSFTPKQAKVQLSLGNYYSEVQEIKIIPIPYLVSLIILVASSMIILSFFALKYIFLRK